MRKDLSKSKKVRLLIKKCHVCGQITESNNELDKCIRCGKGFLPLNYFEKIHNHKDFEFTELFASSHEIHEEELVKGLYVLW